MAKVEWKEGLWRFEIQSVAGREERWLGENSFWLAEIHVGKSEVRKRKSWMNDDVHLPEKLVLHQPSSGRGRPFPLLGHRPGC